MSWNVRTTRVLVASLALAGVHAGAVERLREAADGIYVGGKPDGDAAWRELAELGVQTVVSVEGIPPGGREAEAHGVRPIHIPIGYGGIEPASRAQLARVAAGAQRPLFIYCHHGRHRGPAAAAIVCRAAGLLDEAGSLDLLAAAGTSRDYAGLWRDVAAFDPDTIGAAAPLLARAPVSPLRLAMAELDHAWGRALDTTAGGGGRDEPLLLVVEALVESRRAGVANSASPDLLEGFDRSIATARELRKAQGRRHRQQLERRLAKACVDCHAAYRD